jgi:class 3 adenylate cyclase
MLACNRLRIDPGDGFPVVDYRIENGGVESRTLETEGETSGVTEKGWQRLTSEQLTAHVMTDTVVAHWLHRRMGARRLIRVITQHSSSANDGVQEHSGRIAA